MRLNGFTKVGTVAALASVLVLAAPLAAQAATFPLGALGCPSPKTVSTHSYSNGSPQHHQVRNGVDYSKTFPLSYVTKYHRYWNPNFPSVTNSYIIVVEYTGTPSVSNTCEW